MKDETLYLYPLIIDSYRKLMSKYIELTNLTGEKYITKMEEIKKIVDYENSIYKEKYVQLKDLNEFVIALLEQIENIEECYIEKTEEVLIYRIFSKIVLGNWKYANKEKKLKEFKKELEKDWNIRKIMSMFYISMINEEINEQKDLKIQKILKEMMYCEIFSDAMLEEEVLKNDFNISDSQSYSMLMANDKKIEQIAIMNYDSSLDKILRMDDKNLEEPEKEALLIYLVNRLKANLILLSDEKIADLNYEFHSKIENLNNIEIQNMVQQSYSDLRKNIKKYRKNK